MPESKEKILGLAASVIFAVLGFMLVGRFTPLGSYLGKYASEIVLAFLVLFFTTWFFIKHSLFIKYLTLGIFIVLVLRLIVLIYFL